MACDVLQLLEEGRPYQALNSKERALVRLKMLCEIRDAAQGLNSNLFGSVGSPEGVVDATGPALCVDADGVLYTKPPLVDGIYGWVQLGR